MVTLRYTFEKKDFIAFYMFVNWESPEKKKSFRWYYLRQVAVNLFFIGVLFYSNLFQYWNTYLYIYLGIVIGLVLLQGFSTKKKLESKAAKIAADPANSSMFTEMEIQVSPAGIKVTGSSITSTYQWCAFTRKSENDTHFFLFTSAIQALILPKTAFSSQESLDEFRQLLLSYLSLEAELGLTGDQG